MTPTPPDTMAAIERLKDLARPARSMKVITIAVEDLRLALSLIPTPAPGEVAECAYEAPCERLTNMARAHTAAEARASAAEAERDRLLAHVRGDEDGIWPLEIRDAVDALEEKYGIFLSSSSFAERHNRLRQDAEAKLALLEARVGRLVEWMRWAITGIDMLIAVTHKGLLRSGIEAKAEEGRRLIADVTSKDGEG